jgi:hypothetical protein
VACGRNDTAAPVSKAVAVGRDQHGRGGDEVIGSDDVGRSREVRADNRDQRRCVRKIVDHLEADADLHAVGRVPIALFGKWQNARSPLVRIPALGTATLDRNGTCMVKMATKQAEYNATRGLISPAP